MKNLFLHRIRNRRLFDMRLNQEEEDSKMPIDGGADQHQYDS